MPELTQALETHVSATSQRLYTGSALPTTQVPAVPQATPSVLQRSLSPWPPGSTQKPVHINDLSPGQ